MIFAFRLCLVAWAALWFGVIAPGHERGIVRVPGKECGGGGSSVAERSCCSKPAGGQQEEGKGKTDPASVCAICKLNASLNVPPPIAVAPQLVGLLTFLSPLAPAAPSDAPVRAPFHSRGPPIA